MNFIHRLFAGNEPADLKDVLSNGAFLVDVREPWEFEEASIAGAVNIPLSTIPSQLEKFRNKENIILFCRSGNRSEQARSILKQNGITNVVNGGSYENILHFVQKLSA